MSDSGSRGFAGTFALGNNRELQLITALDSKVISGI